MEGKDVEVELKNPYFLLLLGFLLVLFYFEVNVTLNGPIAFGDEGYWTSMAKMIATNREYPVYQSQFSSLLKQEGFAETPLFAFFEGSFYFLFGFSETIIKFLLPILSFFLGLAIFVIFKRLYSDKIGFFTAIISMTLPAIVTYSVLFYVDIFFVYWVTFAIGFFMIAVKEEKKKYLFFSGLFAALAILTKKPALIFPVFYGIYFLYEVRQKKNFFSVLRKYLPLAAILIIVTGSFAVRNLAYFNTPLCGLPYVFTTDKCNIDIQYNNSVDFATASSNTGTDQNVYQYGLINYFHFTYGLLWFVPLVFFIGLIYLLVKMEKLDFVVITFLIAGSIIFAEYYQTRAEDASRYTLFAVPVLALVCGIYLEKIMEILKSYYKYLGIGFLILILIVSYYNFYTKVLAMPQVKQFSPLFFDACKWVKQNIPENATLLSLYSAQTAYNCDRNAVWELQDLPDIVLGNSVNLTVSRLRANGIDWIFVQKFALSSQSNRDSYPTSFIAFLESNPQTFKKVFENGPDYNTCIQSGGCDGTAIYQVVG